MNITIFGMELSRKKIKSFSFTGHKNEEVRNISDSGKKEVFCKYIKKNYKLKIQLLKKTEMKTIYEYLKTRYKANTEYIIVDTTQELFAEEMFETKIEHELEYNFTDIKPNYSDGFYEIDIELSEVET